MLKSIHDFTKIFSILFFLCGGFFVIRGAYPLACLTFLSFFIIHFIDSDWAFENFKIPNHNHIVVIITFILIFINFFAIYQEMKYSPLITKIKPENVVTYNTFENKLYEAISPCTTQHNELMKKLNKKETITQEEIKAVNNTCYAVVKKIDSQEVSASFPREVRNLCMKTKEEFKTIATNLTAYNYSSNDSQQWLVTKIKLSLKTSIANMRKIREVMGIKEDLDDSKKSFINL